MFAGQKASTKLRRQSHDDIRLCSDDCAKCDKTLIFLKCFRNFLLYIKGLHRG